MTRSRSQVQSRARHKKLLRMAKGYRGRSKNCYRIAVRRVEKGLQYAYRDRRVRKRSFRELWIQRINAATRSLGLPYSRFVNGLRQANLQLNRKIIADLAVYSPNEFRLVYEQARTAIRFKTVSKETTGHT